MAINKKKTSEKTDSEMIRRLKSNPFVFIGTFFILVLVVVAFVMPSSLGLYSDSRRDADLTFGYYDKVPISFVSGNYFARYYEMSARYWQTMEGENFSPLRVWRESFEAAAIHTAILQEMKKAGYTAPEKIVDREIAQLPQFQDNERFSPALYRQLDDNRRLALFRQIQEEIVKARFLSDVTGLLNPTAETEFICKMASVERSFEMAVFSVNAYPETEYEAYIRQNPGLFRSARLSILTVNSSEQEAQRILASIKNEETTFEDAARAYSKDSYADRGGDMGPMMAHELRFDIPDESDREKVMAIARDEYSGIIKTYSGWSFFRAEDDVQEVDISDSVIMDKVRSYMSNNEGGRMEDWAVAQADSFITLVNEIGFEEALAEQRIQANRFGPVPINYGNMDLFAGLPQSIPELAGAAVNEIFWKTAFSTPINSPSRPVVQGSNVLVLFPTSETEAEEDTLETIGSIYSGSMNNISEQVLRQHLIRSPIMIDNFYDMYQRYFMRQ